MWDRKNKTKEELNNLEKKLLKKKELLTEKKNENFFLISVKVGRHINMELYWQTNLQKTTQF